MRAYSMDLRERIVAAREAGQSVTGIAHRFGVCTLSNDALEKLALEAAEVTAPKKVIVVPGRLVNIVV